MYKFNEYVRASSVWPSSKDYEDKGLIPGLLRGYNIEVKKSNEETFWMSCEYISNEPQEVFNDDFHLWMYNDHLLTPTGRIVFRGYAYEAWDSEVGEYVVSCDENGREI